MRSCSGPVADQIGRKPEQAVELAVIGGVCQNIVPVLEIAEFGEAVLEAVRQVVGRRCPKEADPVRLRK